MTLAEEIARRGLDWIVPDWPAPANVRALMTTRNGGFSGGACRSMNLGRRGDDPHDVDRNQALLSGVCGVAPHWLSQTHGTDVATIGAAPAACVAADAASRPPAAPPAGSAVSPLPEADAAVAWGPGPVATVRVGDCLPVLFCDRHGTRVAAAHAGWRGLCAGVLEATVAAMRLPGADIIAWLGPAIGPAAFEVGADVRSAFVDRDPGAATAFAPCPGRPGKWLADLYLLARLRLGGVGVTAVHGGGFCTLTDAGRFFSHRRDKSPGRMAALVWLVP